MRRRRTKILVEPPAHATGDIAFNLIVFFLVCASVQPDSGRQQTLPSSETVEESKQTKNIEVAISRLAVIVNGDVTLKEKLFPQMKALLSGKTQPDQKVVVVKSDADTPYSQWIYVTSVIEDAGGIVTLQLEEEREVQVP